MYKMFQTTALLKTGGSLQDLHLSEIQDDH
jgi:hypothetical protein